MGLGTILSLLPWLIAGLVLLALLGFGRPVVEAITRTWTELALPLLKKVIASPYGLAVVAGVAFVLWTGGVWYFADRGGYARAQGECDATIAVRERDAIRQERDELRKQLDTLETIRMNDRQRAAEDEAARQKQKDDSDAFKRLTGPCFDIDTVRRLFGR